MSRGETNVKVIKTTVILHKFYNLCKNFEIFYKKSFFY